MANPFDQFDAPKGSNPFDQFDAPKAPQKEPERTWGEFAADTGIGLAKGAVSVAKLVPMTVGFADTIISKAFGLDGPASGGALDNAPVRALNAAEEYLQSKKSDAIQAKEKASEQKAQAFGQRFADDAVFDVPGFGQVPVGRIAMEMVSKMGTALTDPSLLAQGVSENIASVLPSGAAARGAQTVAEAALPRIARGLTEEAVSKTARTIGVAGGITTGAVQQGADVASETYDKVTQLSDDLWASNPRFVELSQQIGPDKAKKQIAGELATEAGVKAGIESLVVNAAGAKFGGATLESMFLKPATVAEGAAGKGLSASTAKGFVKGGLGEAVTEAPEEGYGAYATNVALQQINPNQDLFQGVGSAAGQGAVTAMAMGSVTGAREGLAEGLISRQRDAIAQQKLAQAKTASEAAAAANEMAGTVTEVEQAVDALNGVASAQRPAEAAPAPAAAAARPTMQQLQQRADREAALLEQARTAGTEFERLQALEQIQALRNEAPARTAGDFVDLTPMTEMQAQQRLAVLRDQAATTGQSALGLEVVPHPGQADRFAIASRATPNLNLTPTPAAPVSQAEASSRLEAAAQEGQRATRNQMMQPFEAVTDQLQRGIEANEGSIPAPGAVILDNAQVGVPANKTGVGITPYDTVTGTVPTSPIVVPNTVADQNVGEKRQAAQQAINEESMAEQEARSVANQQQAGRALQAQIEQTSQPAAAPATADVIDALKTPGNQRTAEQVLAVRQAQSRYSAADMSLLERAATAPFTLSLEERGRLRELAAGPAPVAAEQQTRETPNLMGERVARALGLPSNGVIVTGDFKLSTTRPGPGQTGTVTDVENVTDQNGNEVIDPTTGKPQTRRVEHKYTVVDPSKLGNTGRLLTQIARIFGKRLVVFQSATLRADGFVAPGNDRDIHINVNSRMSPLAVFGHELMHLLRREHPEAYAAVEAVIKSQLTEEQFAAFERDYGVGANLEELASDLMGNRFQEPQFWTDVFDEIARQNPTGAAGIIARVGAALNRAIAAFLNAVGKQNFEADEIIGDVTAVRAALQTALAQYAKQQRNPAIAMEAGANPAAAPAQPFRYSPELQGNKREMGVPLVGTDERVMASRTRQADQPEGRVGQVDTHVLNAVRGERAKAERTKVGADEKAIIREAAAKMKMPISEVEQMVRDHKAAHPADAGWAQLTLTGVKVDEDTGKGELQYQVIPYSFNQDSVGKALEPGTAGYTGKVANLAQAMEREVRAVYDRAQAGDQAAKNIIAQSGWYKEMRTRLRQEFGGLGDLFADLLGATSPNTPVRTNWDNSVEALRLATTGAFDKLLPKWIDYFNKLDQAETQFRGVFDEMLKRGMTKAEIKRSPEFLQQQELVRAARNFPDELLPLKSNGKKFGFNGYNVARAMVDLWRVVKNADPDIGRGGTAPKAINFSGNLIGFRSRATIDVWAARMLQRLAGGLRIPSMAEGGVSGEALESGRNTLQFGFGQDVFSDAVKLIRNDPVLSQDPTLSRINDDDLQALVWFIEKEVWTKGNWTSAAGEGGSFEFESDLAGVSDRERVNELRKTADSSVASTAEQRAQAEADITRITQEMAALPAIAQANAKLEANAARVAADKAAPRGQKLSKEQKAEIRLQNTAAQAAKKKAKASKAYKALESELNRAKAVLKKPTVEQRQEMRAGALRELGKIARPVDRFTVGLSIQKGAEQGMEPTPPSDAQMAVLAERVADSVVAGDPGATVIGLKAIATEGRYGAPERALDLEAIVRDNFDARPLARTTFEVAQEADQDAAFVARVLRPNELFDPQMHRPGVEIYFRDMNQATEAARMMAEIAGMRVAKTTEFGPGYFEIGGYTVIVDGRPSAEAARGEMGKPVGMRVLYMPEFEARYGMDARLENATDEQLASIIEERADSLVDFADSVLRQFDGVSFAGRFNYEVETRFAGEYQGAIDAYSSRTTDERNGTGEGQAWRGRSSRESIAAAVGRPAVDAGQPGTELPGGNRADSEGRLSPPRQTETPAFRNWFGDSKVVDANGNPKMVYHGTRSLGEDGLGIEQFKMFKGRIATGAYFADNPEVSDIYSRGDNGNVLPVYLSLQNPATEDDVFRVAADATNSAQVTQALKKAGYDGLIINVGADSNYYVAFNPTQIKSAIGNSGAFDATNPSITASRQREAPDTPAFRNWFGDSKVVDAEGKPLVVYHGSTFAGEDGKGISQFKSNAQLKREGKVGLGYTEGIYFTADPDYAAKYAARGESGNNIVPVYLSVQNPKIISSNAFQRLISKLRNYDDARSTEVVSSIALNEKGLEELRAQGYDGIINKDLNHIVVFDPSQIKSAIGNNGEYSRANADITASRQREAPDTPAFRRWFGDSKVVDGNGEPLVVYHSTEAARVAENQGAEEEFDAAIERFYEQSYFSANPAEAQSYAMSGQQTYPVYLSIKKPYETTDYDEFAEAYAGLADRLERKGYDGIIYRAPGEAAQFLAFRPEQIKSAIGNNGEYNPNNPDITASRTRIVGDSKRDYTPEQRAYFERVGRTVTEPTLKERVQELRKDLGKKLAQGIVDQFRPLRDLSEKAYALARLSKGSAGAFEALLHHGKLSIKDGVYDGDQSGGFIERVGVPLHGELEDFLWWVAANRAERLMAEDRENLFTPEDIAAGKTLDQGTANYDYTLQHDTGGKKAGSVTRDRTLIYRDALKTFDEFNKNTMDMAEQSGLIDSESRPFWENEFYVPFYRVADQDGSFIGGGMKDGLVRQRAFQRLKGGSEKLNSDLLANTLSNWGHLIDAAAKNRAAKESLEAAQRIGIAIEADADTVRSMAKSMNKRGDVVWFMDQGKERYFLIDDPMVMTAISSLSYAGLRGPIMDALSAPKHWLTVGVTASPAFKIKNLVRDSLQAVATAPLSYNVPKNLAEGVKASNRSSQTYVSALASGGLIRFGTMLEGSQAKRTRQLIKMGVKDTTILDSESKVQAMYDKFIEPAVMAYNELGNRGEEINRASLFKQLQDQGMDQAQAALMARDLMDFSMQGSWTAVRFLTQVVPFMNARLQGLYKLGRAANEDPKRFGVVLGAVAMASIALMLAYQDDDDWKKREDWDRNNFWWFKVGGVAFRIPKPFEIGTIATLAERGLEYFINPEMTGKRLGKNVKDMMLDSLSMNPVPQLVKPLVDIYSNKDSFSGRPIETMGMDRLQPQYRYTSGTSMVARGLSTATMGALSPVQYDHLIRGYFAWLGSFVVGATDMILRPLTGQPSRPTADYFKAATGNIVSEVSSGNSRYVSQMYDQAERLEQAMGTYRMLMKTGKKEEAREYFQANKEDIVKYGAIEKVKAAETRYNELIRMIERSNLDPDVKKERIRAVQAQKDKVARIVAPGYKRAAAAAE